MTGTPGTEPTSRPDATAPDSPSPDTEPHEARATVDGAADTTRAEDPARAAGTSEATAPAGDGSTGDQAGADAGQDDEAGAELSPLERLRAEKEHLTDALARTQAEFANYRKRIARDQGQLQDRAKATVLEAFVPALDALDAAANHDDTMIGPVRKVIADTTERLGLERFEPGLGDPFDPAVHEAVSAPPDGDGAELVIESVLRPGYRLGSKLLRAAEVTVDTAVPGADEPAEDDVTGPDGTE